MIKTPAHSNGVILSHGSSDQWSELLCQGSNIPDVILGPRYVTNEVKVAVFLGFKHQRRRQI